MVYNNKSRVVPISTEDLGQITECLIMARQELQGAGSEGWVCTTGIEQEIITALETTERLLNLNARLDLAIQRALEIEKQ